MTDLRFLDPTGLVNRAAFNERFEQLNSAAFVGTGGLVDINGNTVRETYMGSYVGTGTYGSSHPCTVSFPFAPKLFLILGYTYNISGSTTNTFSSSLNATCPMVILDFLTEEYKRYYGPTLSNSTTYQYARKSSDGKTLQWYNTESANDQFNTGIWNGAPYVYYFLAIG